MEFNSRLHRDQTPYRSRDIIVAGLLAILIMGCFYGSSPNFRGGDLMPLFGGDYFQEWFGGRIVQSGISLPYGNPQRADLLQHDEEFLGVSRSPASYFPIVYPPFYYALVSPLCRLAYPTAAMLWALGMATGYFLSVFLVMHFLRSRRSRKVALLAHAIIPAGLLFPPIAESLVMNQKGTLCLLVVTSTFVLLQKGKCGAAGFCFGWMFFKPHLALPILLVMAWKRQFRFCAGCFAVLGFLIAIGGSAGLDSYRSYVDFVRQAPDYIYTTGYDLAESHCVDSFFHGVFSDRPVLARPAAMIATVVLAVSALRLMKGPVQFGSERFGLQYSGLVLTTVLVSPHLYGYDLSMLLLPLVVASSIANESVEEPWRKAILVLSLAIFSMCGLSEIVAAATGFQTSVILISVLLGLIFVVSQQHRIEHDGVSEIPPKIPLGS